MPEDDIFKEGNEVKIEYKNLKFGKVGDWFRGTLTSNTRQIKNNLSDKGEMQTIFEFKAKGGAVHLITNKIPNETATDIVAGEFWSFITGKAMMLELLKPAKIGQEVGLRLSEIRKPAKPGQEGAKIINVYLGEMDPTYQGETAADAR